MTWKGYVDDFYYFCTGGHLWRFLSGAIGNTVPTLYEVEHMDACRVPQENRLRIYLAWRRSTLVFSMPLLIFAVVIGTMNALDDGNWDFLNTTGKVIWLLPTAGPWFLVLFSIASWWFWGEYRVSSKLLKIGWGLSFVLPLVPSLVPFTLLVKSNLLTEALMAVNDANLGNSQVSTVISNAAGQVEMVVFELEKMILAIGYMLKVFPVLITFPGGAMSAAIRIRHLIKESRLSSWVLVFVAPLYSTVILVALVAILQLAGDGFLIAGAVLLTVNPWFYVIFRKYLVCPPTAASERKLRIVLYFISVSSVAGYALLIAFVFMSNLKNYIGWTQVVELAIVGISRTTVTWVLYGDIFLRATVTDWNYSYTKQVVDGEDFNAVLLGIQGGITKGYKKKTLAKDDLDLDKTPTNDIEQGKDTATEQAKSPSSEDTGGDQLKPKKTRKPSDLAVGHLSNSESMTKDTGSSELSPGDEGFDKVVNRLPKSHKRDPKGTDGDNRVSF